MKYIFLDESGDYCLNKLVERNNYRIIGLPFYNQSRENDFEQEFLNAIF